MNLDIAYANAEFIPNAGDYPPRWAKQAQNFRDASKELRQTRLGLPYAAGARNQFDLFFPDDAPQGVVVFVHGGYWRRFDRSDWSHFAAGLIARGWAVAMPSYTLAPQVRIRDITKEVARAINVVASMVAGPMVLTGHSAGGHLVARMNCADTEVQSHVAGRIKRIVPISPVSDLRPLEHTEMNADFRLDASEAAAESPVLHGHRRGIETKVWVGAEERPAFLDQARWLADAWDEAELHIAPGCHHFDVIDGLQTPQSTLVRALVDGL